jgi:hypothetical protein
MFWTVMPFGNYEGKTLPEIIMRDPDWFLWMLPKLNGKLAKKRERLLEGREQSKSQKGKGRRCWSSIDTN